MSNIIINNKINESYKLNLPNKNIRFGMKHTNPDSLTLELIPAQVFKAYALAQPNFKGSNLSFNNIDFLLTDENVEPRIRVEIINNDYFKVKQGIKSIYQNAAQDQLQDLLEKNPNLKEEGSFIKANARRFDVSCSEKDLIDTLNLINDSFVNIKINKEYFENAKTEYQIQTNDINKLNNQGTMPIDFTKEDNNCVNNISDKEIEKYCNDILDNSDVKIVLQANRKFYNDHKSEILLILSKIVGK